MKYYISFVLSSALCVQAFGADCDLKTAITDGQVCIPKGDQTLEASLSNSGKLILEPWIDLTFKAKDGSTDFSITSTSKTGVIEILGRSEIIGKKQDDTFASLSIKNQAISIANNGRLTLTGSSLTLGEVGKGVSISARNSADLVINQAKTLNFIEADLTNLKITSNDTTGLNITKTSLKNTTAKLNTLQTLSLDHLDLEKSTISTNQNLTISQNTSSLESGIFKVTHQNFITASNSLLSITKGTYGFEGGGHLIFGGKEIKVGASQSNQVFLKGQNSIESTQKDKTKTFIAFNGLTTFEDVKAEDLTLKIFGDSGATLNNIQLTLMDINLEGRRTDDKESQKLIIDNRQTKGSGSIPTGTITITKKDKASQSTSTFLAKNVEIYGQTINVGTTNETAKITFALKTDENAGTITLGRANSSDQDQDGEVLIAGQHQNTGEKQTLKINANQILIGSDGQSEIAKGKAGGSVTLQNLVIQTQSKDEKGMTFGLQSKANLTLDHIELSTQGLEGDKKYQSLTFTAEKYTNVQDQSTLQVVNDSILRASQFTFKNQNLNLKEGKSLHLYAYGALKEGEIPKESAVFNFNGTTFKAAKPSVPNASLKLYSYNGAKLIGDFALKDIELSSQTLNSSPANQAFDLTDSSSTLRALGNVALNASEFKFGQDTKGASREGVGMDIVVGDKNEAGKLIFKSDSQNTSFAVRNLTIDHRSLDLSNSMPSQSTFDVKMKENTLSDLKLGLEINGALSVLHQNLADQTSEFKAQTLTFTKDSNVMSENGKLTLISKETEIKILGKTILSGSQNAIASIEAKKDSAAATLSLHDIEVRGKAELGANTTFNDSNLSISKQAQIMGDLVLKNTGTITGIQSITLDDAHLSVGESADQEMTLNTNAAITSRGISSIKASSLGSADEFLTLNVQNGTFTLMETTTKNAIGAMTLGQKGKGTEKANGANLELKQNNSTYNALQINSTITSYGASSIIADEFGINSGSKDFKSQPLFAINEGELALIATKTSQPDTPTLHITQGEIELNHGALAVYTNEDKSNRGSITLGQSTRAANGPKITSSGDSKIIAKTNELKMFESEISSSGGMLTLVGLSADSTLKHVSVKNNGSLLALESESGNQTAMKISANLTMISNTPYIKVEKGKPSIGGFGSIKAQSLLFLKTSSNDQKLINLKVLSDDSQSKISAQSLFTLREGDQTLIETEQGIKKGEAFDSIDALPITYEDISSHLGGYKSLELTPILQCGKKDAQGNLIACKLDDRGKPIETPKSLAINIKVKQNSLDEVIEQLDSQRRQEMEDFLSQGRYKEIGDAILSAPSNALKIGIVANILKEIGTEGNMEVALEALAYSSDAFETMANLIKTHQRNFEQISSLSFGTLQNRMARLNNPHSLQENLASLIRSASKYRYASNDDEVLLATDEVELDKGGLWASYDGVMRSGRNISSSVNGLSAGYDGIIGQNVLLGGFVSYLYGQYNGEFLSNASHNLHFGLYSRMAFGGNEIDLVFSQIIAFNQGMLNLGQTQIPALLNGKIGFNMYASDIQAHYGYAFALGDEESPYYLKPLVGVDVSFMTNDSIQTQEAIQSIYVPKRNHFQFDVLAGVELRKYFNPQSYVFILPLVEMGIVSLGNDAQVGFVGAKSLLYQFDHQKDINVGIYAGGQGSVAENLAISGGLGLKMGVKNTEVITSWNVGLRYKF